MNTLKKKKKSRLIVEVCYSFKTIPSLCTPQWTEVKRITTVFVGIGVVGYLPACTSNKWQLPTKWRKKNRNWICTVNVTDVPHGIDNSLSTLDLSKNIVATFGWTDGSVFQSSCSRSLMCCRLPTLSSPSCGNSCTAPLPASLRLANGVVYVQQLVRLPMICSGRQTLSSIHINKSRRASRQRRARGRRHLKQRTCALSLFSIRTRHECSVRGGGEIIWRSRTGRLRETKRKNVSGDRESVEDYSHPLGVQFTIYVLRSTWTYRTRRDSGDERKKKNKQTITVWISRRSTTHIITE